MARFNPAKYDPANDSSVGTNVHRATAGDDNGFEGVILFVREGHCICGCLTKVGKKSRFAQGHDARYKGILLRAHRTGTEITVMDQDSGMAVSSPAVNLFRDNGWERFIPDSPEGTYPRAVAPKVQEAPKVVEITKKGAWYTLPDGSKVRGQAALEQALGGREYALRAA